ncbi:molybdenum cofactor guanylyltransferase [Streptomonospora nanhaiensis]|uniref:Molybdopterin-guanine dinucleotide biosynthesis protein A n=1 Tax=Streptomonospora nanhaiensis TaxID=1323731 RepID=A0A853BGX7_9ACTN|nr:NTP transferase domain-containing protein [Streptomonospora nanhaiensis]MBV2366167.1 NTP transferase domain-containing protein [Streptomonospora nanhaiensis]MBX9390507.1 NTP transferase domain-containing protein [Streptomonospora nanhaiensis]NYI94629.1 molybdopterin-guanine dinucleotide biosynthesis protein A [Streptomonospora nanhaiensis]
MPGAEPFDAVVLAGGAARRMGGGDKPGLTVGGTPLVERVAAAARAAAALVVVGPPRERPAARYVREDPPGAGPVPALRAGLTRVERPWFALLAGDLPFVRPEDVAALLAAARRNGAGAVLVDGGGRPQWLLGAWRTERVRAALADYTGGSLRGLLGPLGPALLPAAALGGGSWAAFDCDTPEELAAARAVPADPAADRPGGPHA